MDLRKFEKKKAQIEKLENYFTIAQSNKMLFILILYFWVSYITKQ